MRSYRADFIAANDRSSQVLVSIPLEAKSIQGAIDEAMATLEADRSRVTSIDIFCGDDKVETVGVGPDSART